MGAWDFGPFDNDDAADWLYDLAESSDESVIEAAFKVVIATGKGYLEAPDCANALAAAEIVAALRGHPMAELPKKAKAWVEKHEDLDPTPLIPEAEAAIQRIRSNSELNDLWSASDNVAMWHETLDDVSSRLSAR